MKYEPSDTSPLEVQDIREYVHGILVEKFGNSSRSIIEEFDDRWNFACPFCGDSNVDKTKKRGNMYLSDFHFHCFNCGEHESLLWFLKKFDRDIKPGAVTSFVQNTMTRTGMTGVFSKSDERISEIFGDEILEYAIDKDVLIATLNLIPASESVKAKKYLHGRCQYDMQRFAWDSRKNRLFIFNLSQDGNKVLGYQIRSFWNKGPKYLTYEMSTMYKELGLQLDQSVAKRLDPISTTFGCMQVNFSNPITVFEGPLDSFLMPNSIALCSLSRKPPFLTNNMRFMFDYDKSAKVKSAEYLHEGMTVFMWKKFLLDNIPDFHDLAKVDFTDVNIYAMTHNRRFEYDSYFTNKRLDVLCI